MLRWAWGVPFTGDCIGMRGGWSGLPWRLPQLQCGRGAGSLDGGSGRLPCNALCMEALHCLPSPDALPGVEEVVEGVASA